MKDTKALFAFFANNKFIRKKYKTFSYFLQTEIQ